MKQERVQKQKGQTQAEVSDTEETNSDVTNEELQQAVDATLENIDDVLDAQLDEELLDDIDSILEKDAETFVAQYINQGGQ